MNYLLYLFGLLDFAFLFAAPNSFPAWFFVAMNAQAALLLMLSVFATIKPKR
jgi:hypothetical protein